MGEVYELLDAGLGITLIGLGVVFALLTLLVGVLHGMSALARAIEGPPAEASAPAPAIQTDDGELIAVIAAAVGRYRGHGRRGA